ncbi:MAG TPA: hypothetical protein VFB96_14580, partial [Pirellulaceae bacterium]|nr:hypothetical protein [Pirellulaceae bacterium]
MGLFTRHPTEEFVGNWRLASGCYHLLRRGADGCDFRRLGRLVQQLQPLVVVELNRRQDPQHCE